MIKDAVIKSKFEYLQDFLGRILHDIRREIKQEHLKQDRAFVLKHFGKNQVDKVEPALLQQAYLREIVAEGNESLGEWVGSKWIVRHAEMYDFFVKELTKVNPKFDEITLLEISEAKALAASSVEHFGVVDTLIFSVVNSVAFSDEIFNHLKFEALKKMESDKQNEIKIEKISIEDLKRDHEMELLKLSDRFEKRFQSISKKYAQDVEGLKKQIGLLQKKLCETRCS